MRFTHLTWSIGTEYISSSAACDCNMLRHGPQQQLLLHSAFEDCIMAHGNGKAYLEFGLLSAGQPHCPGQVPLCGAHHIP